jgi:hypothetical protein
VIQSASFPQSARSIAPAFKSDSVQAYDELVFEAPEGEVEATLPVVQWVTEQAPMPALSLIVSLALARRAQLGRGALSEPTGRITRPSSPPTRVVSATSSLSRVVKSASP